MSQAPSPRSKRTMEWSTRMYLPGTYTLVDHSLGRLEKGAAGQLWVEGPENPEIFHSTSAGAPGH